MQIVFDYLTGKIHSEEFKAAWYSDPEIGQWLENLVDLKSGPTSTWDNAPYPEFRIAIYKHYDGSVLKLIEASETASSKSRMPKWVDIGWYFEAIASIVTVAYPEIKPTSFYDDEKDYFLSVVGDYLGGPEVENQIADLLNRFPRSMGKGKRKKAAKVAIREYFHLMGSKYPRWVQEPEWPMGTNTPMEFVSQKKNGEQVLFTFRDVDTDEIRIVEQLY